MIHGNPSLQGRARRGPAVELTGLSCAGYELTTRVGKNDCKGLALKGQMHQETASMVSLKRAGEQCGGLGIG